MFRHVFIALGKHLIRALRSIVFTQCSGARERNTAPRDAFRWQHVAIFQFLNVHKITVQVCSSAIKNCVQYVLAYKHIPVFMHFFMYIKAVLHICTI